MNAGTVEYMLRARDMISPALSNASRMANTADRNINGINRAADAVGKQAPGKINRLTASMQASSTSATSLASNLGRVVGAFALFQGAKGLVKMGMDLEQARVGFEVMLGSADKARNMLADIDQFAKVTPFEPEGLRENAKLLLNFGIAQDKIMPNLKMLGDIAMGDAQKMNSLTLAFSQMSSAGKLQGQDLLQMINAGFNPLQELTKMTGKSMATLREEMSAGKISVDMVQAAFENATGPGGQFFNMMDKMSKSTSGKLSTLVGDLKQVGAEIGMKLLPYVNKFIERMMPLATWIGENADLLLKLAGVVLGAVVAFKSITFVMGLWNTVTKLMTLSQWALNGAMIANPIGLIIAGIAALIGFIVVAINKYDKFGAAMLMLLGPLGMLINAVMLFKRHWQSIVDAFKADGILGGLKRIGIVLLDTLLYPVQQLLNLLSKIPGLGHLAAKGASWIEGVRSRLNLTTEAEKKGTAGPQGELSTDTGGSTAGAGVLPGGGAYDPGKAIGDIAGGGTKATNITVNLNREMVSQITINPVTMTQGATEIRDLLMQTLSQVLNSANQLAVE